MSRSWRAKFYPVLIAATSAAVGVALTHLALRGMPDRLLGPDLTATLTPCGDMTADARAKDESTQAGSFSTMYASYVAARKVELINYTGLVLTSITHLRESGISEAEQQKQVKEIVNQLNFGKEDGYFYLYDIPTLTPLAHPRLPGLVGKSLADNNVIQELVQCAKAGGGFILYPWNRPSTQRDERKLGFVVPINLEGWNERWMLGTGLYVEDLESAREKMHAGIDRAMVGVRLFAFILVFVIVLAVQLVQATRRRVGHEKMLRDRILKAQEELRRALANELHDGSLQVLLGIKLLLENCFRLLQRPAPAASGSSAPGPHAEALQDLRLGLDRLHGATVDIDRVAKRLVPVKLEEKGLLAALESDVREFSSDTGISTTLQTGGNCDELPERLKLTVYRVAQEAQRNVYKHARATRVELSVLRSADELVLVVKDNGCGFDTSLAHEGAGLGLRSMRDRVESVGGWLVVESEPGQTCVTARLPVEPLEGRAWPRWRRERTAHRAQR